MYIRQFDFHQLWIRRQVTNDGSTENGFKQKEDYRRYPCPPTLARYFLALRKRVEKLYPSILKSELLRMPLITSDETLENPQTRYSAFPPKKLEQLSREIIGHAEIPEQIITVPDDKKGTKETNLAHYQGDIFRSNFQYYALNTAKMTDGELMYLLGNKQHVTFNKYYCDFLNDAAQDTILSKLMRWYAYFMAPEYCLAFREQLSGVTTLSRTEEIDCANPIRIDGEIMLVHKGEEVVFSAHSQHGLDLMVAKMQVAEHGEGVAGGKSEL